MQHPLGNLSVAEKLDWLRLLQTERVGPVTFAQLLDNFDTVAEALANIGELSKRGGRTKPLLPPSLSKIQKLYDACVNDNVQVICWPEEDYPALLREIHDAPPLLFVRGKAVYTNRQTVGMVGARNASANGQTFAKKLAYELGQADVAVISGLARGIDTAAHQGSLSFGTTAVLGGGVNHVYPPENKYLYELIAESGCLISEHPPEMIPKAQHFPRRNRIISGISQSVVLVEAAKRSGSLITARMAAEQGRDVLAVPGSPLDPRCHGTNNLIKQGATLVENAMDILETLSPIERQQTRHKVSGKTLQDKTHTYTPATDLSNHDTTEWREKILAALSPTPVAITELLDATEAPVKIVHVVLLELYLAGKIEHHPGGKVSLLFS